PVPPSLEKSPCRLAPKKTSNFCRMSSRPVMIGPGILGRIVSPPCRNDGLAGGLIGDVIAGLYHRKNDCICLTLLIICNRYQAQKESKDRLFMIFSLPIVIT